ncbi:unnamed protein product [Cyclocybe aegerita]|uniref:Uncharacterized protein n=1 Tax=Cyclocybe aegerita TaxID=1973307 RepID=A0A8S0W0Q4_CYCAE|nr:unnamed protein product [Cyclocybe aegerita]
MWKVLISWDNVEEASFVGITISDAIYLLQTAQKLRKCIFLEVDDGVHDKLVIKPPMVVNSSITSLHMGLACMDSLSDFWGRIRCPSLREVTFHYSAQHLAPFTQFLASSKCSITHLCFVREDWFNNPDEEREILEFFAAVPTLETLDFQAGLPSAFFDKIAAEPKFLPLLRSFRYEGGRRLTCPWMSTIKAVDSRLTLEANDGQSALRSLTFAPFTSLTSSKFQQFPSGPYLEQATVAHLLRLRDRGVEIRIQDGARDVIEASRPVIHGIRNGRLCRIN